MRKKRTPLPLLAAAVFLLFTVWAAETVWPAESGEKLQTNGKLSVDAGNASLGYIRAAGPVSKKKLKLRVTYGGETLTYDLNTDGEFEVFPLQSGSGKYEISLYEQKSGKKYAVAGTVKLTAKLTDEEAAFLCPSQYVNFTEESEITALSHSLLDGCATEKEKVEAVRKYILSNLGYDYVKSLTITSGTLPDIEGCLTKKMGICQDLSAVAVAMLRVQGIHARLVIGYADAAYHAWVTCTADGEEIFFDPTAELKAIKSVKEYTVERIY